MTIITYTMEEANGRLDYQPPELRELSLGLACGRGIDDNKEVINSGNEIFGADGEDEEENETFSID